MSYSPIVLVHSDNPAPAVETIRDSHPDLTVYTCNTYEDFPGTLETTRAEVVYSIRFAGTPHFPRESMLNSETLKWISVGGSGTDHLHPWNTKTLTVTNAAGVAADMMAEYALGTYLSFRLNLRGFQAAQAEQSWIAGKVSPIEGSTALILGLGKTGCAVAKRFHHMGMQVFGVRANPRETEFVDQVHSIQDIDKLLPHADVVVVAVPLLESTRHLLSDHEFSLIKANSVLVDVSRGGVVDESALIQALDNQQLRGAALDVFNEEPLPKEHTLWQRDNVIITPHCSSVYDGWEQRSVSLFVENLSRYCQGKALHNIVDPERGY